MIKEEKSSILERWKHLESPIKEYSIGSSNHVEFNNKI